ncbi:hypothetical protein F3B23_09525 [Bacteroides fragilis]|uniref:Uncharacterized protein n=1 Tax=Bacteroides fragilis TaxID=817 RepID=A0A5M5W0F4_BACFG|nr:hypothetical protein F3B28_06245 [Bacteroides fragilis]KAA4708095.1 hypothetical protein F3B27_11430 [Bacteroides fragilis]KAA4719749.1 hypothetical protein F3B32_08640 [Bacteroides fragilis]KAA4731530.1 hypothetical protein F3B23_09525 [Bacteroides fragilis]KAA4732288.1 hypothetical protein F3B30_06495 [Bacteroides fragilis]
MKPFIFRVMLLYSYINEKIRFVMNRIFSLILCIQSFRYASFISSPFSSRSTVTS